MEFNLNEEEKKTLLRAARGAIRFTFKKTEEDSSEKITDITENLKTPCGAFVTLTIKGALRGCIGYVEPDSPLINTVILAAKAAAFRDTRFLPLSKNELDEIQIEISVLTPSAPVASYRDIVIGKHGIAMSKYGRHALFLPQVAPERGWDIATTLTHLSMKAGLSPDDWREGAEFEVFEALVFGEGE